MNDFRKSLAERLGNPGLKIKIVFVMAVFILIMAGTLVTFFTYQQKATLIADTQKWGVSLASNLAFDSEYGVLVRDKLILDHLLSNIIKEMDIINVEIFDREGALITDFFSSAQNRPAQVRDFSREEKAALESSAYRSQIKRGILEIAVPVMSYESRALDEDSLLREEDSYPAAEQEFSSKTVGYIRMQISLKRTMADLTGTRNMGILAVGLISVFFGLILSNFLSRAVINPLKVFSSWAAGISAGRYEQKISIDSGDEIGLLAEVFNRMLANIKASHQEIRNKATELEKACRELKETQEQLIQAGKLSAIGQLAAGVSHELNNPLGGIYGYAGLILEKARKKGVENLTGEDLQKFITYVGYISRESIRCRDIIQNLLKFSRKNNREAAFVEVDVNEALEETFLFTQHQLMMNQVELVKRLTPGLPPVMGDKQQLQQVVTNLIINAQQAMGRGGVLTVVTSLSVSPGKGAWVEMRFSDTGCGIPPENLPKLFDPFFTTKPVGQGTGLGLSVSYGIIKDHSGEVEVESGAGEGTTFIVRLPVKGAEKEKRNSEGEVSRQGGAL